MKNLFFILFLAPALIAMAPNLDSISQAFGKGDIATLSKYMDESVELSILDEEDMYDRSEAVSVLKKFFNQNAPKSFSKVHNGTSKGKNSHYCIGNLSSGSRTFRVYMYMKVLDTKYVIQEIRIDQE